MPPEADLKGFFEALKPVQATYDGPYNFADRRADFLAVFSSERGQRVLSQIIDLCEGQPIGAAKASDAGYLAWRGGAREVGHKIIAMFQGVPPVEENVREETD